MNNTDTFLINAGPILGSITVLAIIGSIIKRIWENGYEGKPALKSLLWYTAVVAMFYKPMLIVNIGRMLLRMGVNILTMFGLGGLEGGL